MKENFEASLHIVHETVKEESPETLEQKLEDAELSEMIPEASRLEVYELQKEKDSVMKWLHESLEAIDNGESVESFGHKNLEQHVVDKYLEVGSKDGTLQTVTLGDLVTDGEWGIEYKLEKDVDRSVKKKFVIAEAKREIMNLLNRQIGTVESRREIPKWMAGGLRRHMENIQSTYKTVLDRKERFSQSGFIAETMVETTFRKFQIDNNAPFSFVQADIERDIEEKIDFIIHKTDHMRGVEVEDEDRQNIGVQFTINPDAAEHKLQQIKRSKEKFELKDIDDLVLVTLPTIQTKEVYDRWVKEGMKPGGPTRLWSAGMEESVFRAVLHDFFKEEQITAMWNESREKGQLKEKRPLAVGEFLQEPVIRPKPREEKVLPPIDIAQLIPEIEEGGGRSYPSKRKKK